MLRRIALLRDTHMHVEVGAQPGDLPDSSTFILSLFVNGHAAR